MPPAITALARRLSLAALATASALFLGFLAAPSVAAGATSFGDGAWSFFGDPRATHRDGKSYVGWITTDGRVQVSRYVHATGERRTVTLRNLAVDDHNNPSAQDRADRLTLTLGREEIADVFLEDVGEVKEVVDVGLPLAALPVADGGLGAAQPTCKRLLAPSALLTRAAHLTRDPCGRRAHAAETAPDAVMCRLPS